MDTKSIIFILSITKSNNKINIENVDSYGCFQFHLANISFGELFTWDRYIVQPSSQ